MTPLHSKALKRGIYRKSTPVEAAIARKALGSDVTVVGLHCLMADHQSDQREMLATLGYLIGIGAEVARAIPVAGKNRPALHQALQEVVRMACDGSRWDSSWGAQLSLAAEIAIDLMCDYRLLALRFEPGARAVSLDIKAGRVVPDAIEPLESHLQAKGEAHV